MAKSINLAEIRNFENLEFLAKELVEGFITGLHRSPYHGFSVEFAEHKLYNYGESTKNIDWKVYARTDRLYTKQYEEETNLRCTILLDVSGSMYYPKPGNDKIRFSIYAAAALSFLMVGQRDAVGLVAFADKIVHQTPQKTSRTHLNNLLTFMNGWLNESPASAMATSNIAQNIHDLSETLHKRSLVVIFTDMFQQNQDMSELMGALQHLKHRKHEVLLFHVSDLKSEHDFDFLDQPYKFVDAESGETITLTPNFIRKEYQEKMGNFYHDIKLGCGRLKIDFIEANTSDSFDKILSAYLIKRKRMR